MVIGLGIDLIETGRVRKTLEKFGERFLRRVFVSAEIDYCRSMADPVPHFAARFAAKEAVSKCFGTGIGAEIGWRDIEVVRDERGKPGIRLHGDGERRASELGISKFHVSLSHTEQYACAVAVAEA